MSSENDIALLSAFSLLSLTDFVGNALVCSIILQGKILCIYKVDKLKIEDDQ